MASTVGEISEIWRYPVKSLLGERVERAELTASGLVGDHVYGLFDEQTGYVLSAKRHGRLLEASARWDDETGQATIYLPDGTNAIAGSPACDSVLSAWLGRAVRVIKPEPGVAYEFELNDPDQSDDEPPVLTFPSAPGSLFDGHSALHAVFSSALARARAWAPTSDWSVPRFRPQLVVDDSAQSAAEESWIGAKLRVGPTVLCRARKWTTRCVITTRPQHDPLGGTDMGRDREVLRTLATHTESNLGLYLDTRIVGPIALGDQVVAVGKRSDLVSG